MFLSFVASTAILSWADKCAGNNDEMRLWKNAIPSTEQLAFQDSVKLDTKNDVQEQIFICLDTDDTDAYTHTKVLESVTDPWNTILEYPLNQLFKRYWKNKQPHPLYVSWVAKKIRSLLWNGGIEALDVPQKLNPRENAITSETMYEIWDTLRFPLIDERLRWAFPDDLSEQLKENWFETFSDKDSLVINSINDNPNLWNEYFDTFWGLDGNDSRDLLVDWYTYDIVVKSLQWWKSALAVYRDWKLFMSTYVSIWTIWRKTVTGQYEITWKFPYKRSSKYDNAAMPFALNFYWWYYLHQRNVTWYPLSHGCIGEPWVYADILYSLVLDKEHVDLYIDKNLYETK